MGTFFAILIIAFIGWWVMKSLRWFRRIYNIKREFDNIFTGGAAQQQRSYGQQQSNAGGGYAHHSNPYASRGKVYADNEGEYVDFEEIPASEQSARPQAAPQETYSAPDSQIIDADFEEIR